MKKVRLYFNTIDSGRMQAIRRYEDTLPEGTKLIVIANGVFSGTTEEFTKAKSNGNIILNNDNTDVKVILEEITQDTLAGLFQFNKEMFGRGKVFVSSEDNELNVRVDALRILTESLGYKDV